MSFDELPDRVGERLFDERVVSLFGRLDDRAVADLAAKLWALDALGDEPITLLVSVNAGTIDATAALIDVIDLVGVEVEATCVGALSGPPVAVLAAAHARRAAPNARFFLKDEEVTYEGTFAGLEALVERHHEQRRSVLSRLAESTRGRRSVGDVLADFERGLILGAAEAVRYGLVDVVAPAKDRVVSLARISSGFGFRPPG